MRVVNKSKIKIYQHYKRFTRWIFIGRWNEIVKKKMCFIVTHNINEEKYDDELFMGWSKEIEWSRSCQENLFSKFQILITSRLRSFFSNGNFSWFKSVQNIFIAARESLTGILSSNDQQRLWDRVIKLLILRRESSKFEVSDFGVSLCPTLYRKQLTWFSYFLSLTWQP